MSILEVEKGFQSSDDSDDSDDSESKSEIPDEDAPLFVLTEYKKKREKRKREKEKKAIAEVERTTFTVNFKPVKKRRKKSK